MNPKLGSVTEKPVFNLTDAAHLSKLPPAACFYNVATGHMSLMGRSARVVKTGQEIAAKSFKRHLHLKHRGLPVECGATCPRGRLNSENSSTFHNKLWNGFFLSQ